MCTTVQFLSSFLPSTAGEDYSATAGDLIFQPANASQQLCIAILLLQNTAVENSETFSVQLTTEDPQVTIIPNTSTVTILDDDGTNKPGNVCRSQELISFSSHLQV